MSWCALPKDPNNVSRLLVAPIVPQLSRNVSPGVPPGITVRFCIYDQMSVGHKMHVLYKLWITAEPPTL